MTRKARLWIGLTLLAVIVFNYTVISIPLYKKARSIESNIKAIMIKQVRSGEILKNSEDNYMLDLLKRENIALDKRIVIINCVAVSVTIIIMSWLMFGLILYKKENKDEPRPQ